MLHTLTHTLACNLPLSALHPNHTGVHEENHRPAMHGGLVIKTNSNQRYATDATTAFLVRRVAEAAKVPIQDFCVRQVRQPMLCTHTPTPTPPHTHTTPALIHPPTPPFLGCGLWLHSGAHHCHAPGGAHSGRGPASAVHAQRSRNVRRGGRAARPALLHLLLSGLSQAGGVPHWHRLSGGVFLELYLVYCLLSYCSLSGQL